MSGAQRSPATAGFGAQLRRFREAAALTQEQLAERSGVTVHAISALERGERQRPYPHTIQALATALGLDDAERAALVLARPQRGAPGRVTSIPTLPTPLRGRDADVAAIEQVFGQPEVRLLTLLGPGGVGKTRLALKVANDLARRYDDGAAFVALAAISDPALVIPTIAAALDVRETAEYAVQEVLHGYLGAKRMLLVLDNFEHVVTAAVEVATLIGACPRLTVLVTSRAPLRIRGEREYPLAPLAVPALDQAPLLDVLLESPAVQLFAERAQAVAPTFTLTQANAATVAAICRRLDGLPLALELAAARIKLLGPTTLLARLDRVLPLLVGGAQDLPHRQQTLRQTIAWSYDLLTVEEQQLFRRLGVFAGGWTLEAAAAVAQGADDADKLLDGLQALLDNSMIVQSDDGADRWRMLETIRAYALEQLTARGEAQAVQQAHAVYFHALALDGEHPLLFNAQAWWLERFASEHDNFRAALSYSISVHQFESVITMGWALYRFWSLRGFISEGRQWMETALAQAVTLSPTLHMRALFVIGALAYQQQELAHAATVMDMILANEHELEPDIVGWTLQVRGHVAIDQGAYADAAGYLERERVLWHELNKPWGVGIALTSHAYAVLHMGNVEQAWQQLTTAEQVLRTDGLWWYLALNLNIQAAITLPRGDYRYTEQIMRESVGISHSLRDTWALPFALEGLATVALANGEAHRAARLLGAANQLREPTGHTISSAAWREVHAQHVRALEQLLDGPTLAKSWSEGRAMGVEQAIALALEHADAPASPEPSML